MPDDNLISQLAQQIKAKDDAAARAQQIQLHNADFIKANCEGWFKSFADLLHGSAIALQTQLAGSPSGELPISFHEPLPTVVHLLKEDFPSVQASATLNVTGMFIDTAITSSARKNVQPIKTQNLRLKFDVDGENNLFLASLPVPSQHRFTTAKELADFMMTSAFTV